MDTPKLIERIADCWVTRTGGSVLRYEYPDECERNAKAVDLLGRAADGSPRLVLEHTLVESFMDQRSLQSAAVKMLQPVLDELSGTFREPGHLELAVRADAAYGLKRKTARIRVWATKWIHETAPRLALGGPGIAGHFASAAYPGTRLELTLYRWPTRDGEIGLVFNSPTAEESALAASLTKAMQAKCPKLAEAKRMNPGAASLLLLEIADIALGNLYELDETVQFYLGETRASVPDHVWLVDSSDHPPSVMLCKSGRKLGSAIVDRYLWNGLK